MFIARVSYGWGCHKSKLVVGYVSEIILQHYSYTGLVAVMKFALSNTRLAYVFFLNGDTKYSYSHHSECKVQMMQGESH